MGNHQSEIREASADGGGSRQIQNLCEQLHDGLVQVLTGISLKSRHLLEELKSEKSAQVPLAEALTLQLANAIGHTRDLARCLSPFTAEVEELISMVKRFAATVADLNSIECHVKTPHRSLHLGAQMGSHVFYIIQQAVQNALEHGKASRIEIELACEGGNLSLCVADNGCGFPRPASQASNGLGLQLMNYRAAALGCSLKVASGPKVGTRIIVERKRTANSGAKSAPSKGVCSNGSGKSPKKLRGVPSIHKRKRI
jgi:signal transduction histidine kinase